MGGVAACGNAPAMPPDRNAMCNGTATDVAGFKASDTVAYMPK